MLLVAVFDSAAAYFSEKRERNKYESEVQKPKTTESPNVVMIHRWSIVRTRRVECPG